MNTNETTKPLQVGGSALNDGLGCHWCQEADFENTNVYNTECGHAFSITEDTPDNNFMKFCCYCGKNLIQILFESEYDETRIYTTRKI